MANRPAPPTTIAPQYQLFTTFLAYDYFTNDGLPSGETNHGLTVGISGSAAGWHTLLDIQGRSGALLWAAIAARNNNIVSQLTARLQITVDNIVVTDNTNLVLAPATAPDLQQSAMFYAGKLILKPGDQSLIGGAEADYYPFDSNLKIELNKSLSTGDGGGCAAVWDYVFT